MYLRIRTGTDVAYFGGLINHVLQNNVLVGVLSMRAAVIWAAQG